MHKLALMCAVFVNAVSFCGCAGEEDGPTTSLYKEYKLRTAQLCPDVQESVQSRDIDTANYPYKAVFSLLDNVPITPNQDYPCIFEAKGPQRQTTQVFIKGITADTTEWNFTNSETCSENIKLKFSNSIDDSDEELPKVMCKVPKVTNGDDVKGMLYHPMIWRYPKGKMGLSFSTLKTAHGLLNEVQSQMEFSKAKRFVQIFFTVHYGKSCSLRVQQYMIDPLKEECNKRPYQLCGMYDCAHLQTMLQPLGFWSIGARMEQIEKLLNFVKFRRQEPTYGQILISSLRAMIMPVLFLFVFYISRRLRQHKLNSNLNRTRDRRILSRQGLDHTSHLFNPQAIPVAGGNQLPHNMYDIPINSNYYIYEDLPPPYETVLPPPSYLEATQHSDCKPEESNEQTTTVLATESSVVPEVQLNSTIATTTVETQSANSSTEAPNDIGNNARITDDSSAA